MIVIAVGLLQNILGLRFEPKGVQAIASSVLLSGQY